MDDQRLIDLEMKISQQEDVIDSLQQIVYEQQKALSKLEERLTRFIERVEGLIHGGAEVNPAHEKPPHY